MSSDMIARSIAHRVPKSPCPSCGHIHDGALASNEEGVEGPKPNDYTICLKCRAVNVYGEGLLLREPTEADLLAMDTLAISRAQRLLAKAKELEVADG